MSVAIELSSIYVCCSLQSLGRDSIGIGLYDDILNDLLFVWIEDFGKVLVNLRLCLLQLCVAMVSTNCNTGVLSRGNLICTYSTKSP